MTRGLILYGPPASGKDTITHALAELDPTISLFRRLKAGPGRTGTYRMTTEPEISHLRAAGDVIWENSRYDAVYVIDRPGLTDASPSAPPWSTSASSPRSTRSPRPPPTPTGP